VAVCVPPGELDPTVAFHEQVFGFTVIFEEYIEIGEQGVMSKVVQSPSGGVTFTILQPDLSRQAGQIDDFLAWHDGAGVQHVAFLTKDIVHAVRAAAGRGVEFAETPSSYYDMLAARLGATDIPVEDLRPLGILVDRDHWGQMYQIFAKSTHIRRTYFLELIDRHGARTFGLWEPPLTALRGEHDAPVRRSAGGAGRRPACCAMTPLRNAAPATARYPAASLKPSASPRRRGPTRSIFMLTVIDQARPWLAPRNRLAITTSHQPGAAQIRSGTGRASAQPITSSRRRPPLRSASAPATRSTSALLRPKAMMNDRTARVEER